MTEELQGISARLTSLMDEADTFYERTNSTSAFNVGASLRKAVSAIDDCTEFYSPALDKQMKSESTPSTEE